MYRSLTSIVIIFLALAPFSFAQAQSAFELRQDWQYIAELILANGKTNEANQILNSLDSLSDYELEEVYTDSDLANMINALEEINKAVEAVEQLELDVSEEKLVSNSMMMGTYTLSTPMVYTFPTDLDYPDSNYCPLSPGRSNGLALQIAVDAVQTARVALEVAKGIWAGVSRGCEQTVVVLGEGGNGSVACIPADIALFVAEGLVGVAEGVVEHFEACDSGVDSAEIEGTWKGVRYINEVIGVHVDQLSTHDTDIKAEIVLINEKLDTQKEMLESVLANQQMIMELLKTPSGQREGWNKKP